jgi:hypothetical protein
MTRPSKTGRSAWRRFRGWPHWLRYGQEEIEALYGPDPNHISREERIARAGPTLDSGSVHPPTAGF